MTSTLHGSVTVVRDLAAPPGRVFAAFADSAQRTRWFKVPSEPGSSHHELDFRVGGGEIARGVFAPMGTRERIEYRSRFLDIVDGERIVFAYELLLDDVRRNASLVTVELAPHDGGTRLAYTEQYAILAFDGDGAVDVKHLEGSLPFLLNRLAVAVDGPQWQVTRL